MMDLVSRWDIGVQLVFQALRDKEVMYKPIRRHRSIMNVLKCQERRGQSMSWGADCTEYLGALTLRLCFKVREQEPRQRFGINAV